jgi:8-oxo-dGTP diphosphatase
VNGRVVHAAGGVVTRRNRSGSVEMLAVHRPRYDDWSLPKGKLDSADAGLQDTARREIAEETGFRCVLGPAVGVTTYVDQEGRDKTVSYWLARPIGGSFVPTDEVDALRWFPPKDAALLTRPDDQRIVATAMVACASVAFVFLVRHARAGDRRAFADADGLRPLDEDGARQARQLVGLATGGVVKVWTSSYARCRQTVEPLAAAAGLSVTEVPFLAEGADPAWAVAELERAADGTVACSHGDVIEGVLEALDERGVKLATRRKLAKGSTWVLTAHDGRFVGAEYISAP